MPDHVLGPLTYELSLTKSIGTCFLVMDKKNKIIAILPLKNADEKEVEANAKLIVRAVNNHDALLVACTRAIQVAKRMEISTFSAITSLEYRKETVRYFKQIAARATGKE